MRKAEGVERGAAFVLSVDGAAVQAHPGETLATAMLAADLRAFRQDRGGKPRGLFCNMGVCSECLVTVQTTEGQRRVRACLTAVQPDMVVLTGVAS